MNDKPIALIAIGMMITIIEVGALIVGMNGQLFITAIGSLAGVFGYFIRGKEGANARSAPPV